MAEKARRKDAGNSTDGVIQQHRRSTDHHAPGQGEKAGLSPEREAALLAA